MGITSCSKLGFAFYTTFHTVEQNIAGISKRFKNLDLEFRISLEAPVVPAYQLQTKTNLSIPNTKNNNKWLKIAIWLLVYGHLNLADILSVTLTIEKRKLRKTQRN